MPDNARDTVSVMRVMFKVMETRFYKFKIAFRGNEQ